MSSNTDDTDENITPLTTTSSYSTPQPVIQPQKGKAPTKGAKQILMENKATLNFYRNMSLAAFAAYAIVTAVFYMDNITKLNIFMNLFVVIIYTGSYQMMQFISHPQYAADKSLLDPGLDLNMEGGMGEHVKDIVILTSITHVCAVFSNYFWLLLILVPIRAFWLLWVNFLGPWFFQEAPEETEQDEKKKRKMMRKRYQ